MEGLDRQAILCSQYASIHAWVHTHTPVSSLKTHVLSEGPQISLNYIAGSKWATIGGVVVRTSYAQLILDGPGANCMPQEWLAR